VTAPGYLPGWPSWAAITPPLWQSAPRKGRPVSRGVRTSICLRRRFRRSVSRSAAPHRHVQQRRRFTPERARVERVAIQLHPSWSSQLMVARRVARASLGCSSPSPHATGVSRTRKMSGSYAKSSCPEMTDCRVIALVHRHAYEGSTYLFQSPYVRRCACRGGRQPSRCLLNGSAQILGICRRRARTFLLKGRHCEFGFERAGRRT
jgi:hypothetical protein